MIQTRQDLRDYLQTERQRFWHLQSQFGEINILFTTPINNQRAIWNYLFNLRHLEYHLNNTGLFHKTARLFYAWRLRKLGYKTGFQIPPNTCGKGLMIWHWGTIIINPKARLGENCTLHPMVVIGHKQKDGAAPIIGKNVEIFSGACITGDITIGNNVTIAPNAVVVKDIPGNAVVGGIPAKIIKSK